MPAGRPRIFNSVDEMQLLIDRYFQRIEKTEEIPDIEGLCLELELCRETLKQYQLKEEFTDAIKKAKTKIFFRKKQLAMSGKMNPAVFIFDAKNNHDYVDKQEIAQTVDTTININISSDE